MTIAYDQLVKKYGEPSGDAGFCIMAYGKLGGLELSYESDLDLVFVSTEKMALPRVPSLSTLNASSRVWHNE